MFATRASLFAESVEGASDFEDPPPSTIELILPRRKVKVFDPIGAFDSFVGGFVAALCQRMGLPVCLLWAHAAGCLTIADRGGQGDARRQREKVPHARIPNKAELVDFLVLHELHEAEDMGSALTCAPEPYEPVPSALSHREFLSQSDLHRAVTMVCDMDGIEKLRKLLCQHVESGKVDKLREELGKRDALGYTPKQRAYASCDLFSSHRPAGLVMDRHRDSFLQALRLLCAAEIFVVVITSPAKPSLDLQHSSMASAAHRPYSILDVVPTEEAILRFAFPVLEGEGPSNRWGGTDGMRWAKSRAAAVALSLVMKPTAELNVVSSMRAAVRVNRLSSDSESSPSIRTSSRMPLSSPDKWGVLSAGLELRAHVEALRLSLCFLTHMLNLEDLPRQTGEAAVASQGEADASLLRELTESTEDETGMSLLMAAAAVECRRESDGSIDTSRCQLQQAAVEAADSLVKLLVGHCKKRDAQTSAGATARLLSALQNKVTSDGGNALHLAACAHREEAARTLVLEGAFKLKSLDYHGRKPLQWAQGVAHGRDTPMTELLHKLEQNIEYKFACFISHAKACDARAPRTRASPARARRHAACRHAATPHAATPPRRTPRAASRPIRKARRLLSLCRRTPTPRRRTWRRL